MAGLRMTPQRRVILDLLHGDRWHPTADELFHAVRRRLPRVSLGTVYRNLELLAREGAIGRMESPVGPRRFDGHVARHAHVRCLRCGGVEDLGKDGPPLEELLRLLTGGSLRTQGGYRITGHRVELEGICPECAFGGENGPQAPRAGGNGGEGGG